MVLPDNLGKGGLDLVEDVPVRGGVLTQGKENHEELRNDLGDDWPCPQLVKHSNEIQGEKSCSPCANLVGVVIRLGRGLLIEAVKVVPFCGETGKDGIKLRPRNAKEQVARREVEGRNLHVGRRTLVWVQPQDTPEVRFVTINNGRVSISICLK